MTAKLPPHDADAEDAVIGALLINGAACDEVFTVLRPEDFYIGFNAEVYSVCRELLGRGSVTSIDVVEVGTILKDRGKLDQFGGMAKLVDRLNGPFSAEPSKVMAYAESIAGKARLRRAQRLCREATVRLYEPVDDAKLFLDKLEQDLHEVVQTSEVKEAMSAPDVAKDAADAVLVALTAGTGQLGISSGLKAFDELTGGLHASDHIVVAGRPGMAKTSAALHMCMEVARQGYGALFVSLEMPKEQLGLRMLCQEADLSLADVRSGLLDAEQMKKFKHAVSTVADSYASLWIDDESRLTPAELRAKVRRFATVSERTSPKKKLALVAIDYMQLMRVPGSGNREQEIAEISRSIKGVAKDFRVTTLGLSQLNRAVESRMDRRPQLSDLRECLTGETLIYHPHTGERCQIKDLAGKKTTVCGLRNDLRIGISWGAEVWSTGTKPVFKVRTRTGRTIRCTANHPFRTYSGWTRLENLKVGDLVAVLRAAGLSWSEIGGRDQRKRMGRDTARKLVSKNDVPWLRELAFSEVLWDSIESIEADGEEEVFDMTVPGLHNFVANDFFVHNSGAIEQDADVVLMLYRDSYYSGGLDETAEFIVSKQRNGPTGTAIVRFEPRLTRFSDVPEEK